MRLGQDSFMRLRTIVPAVLAVVVVGGTIEYLALPKSISEPVTSPGGTAVPAADLPQNADHADVQSFQRNGSVVLQKAILDFDGDGRTEVVFLDELYSHVLTLLTKNGPVQQWEAARIHEEQASGFVKDSATLTVADLNQDNRQELLYRELVAGTGRIEINSFFASINGKVREIPVPGKNPILAGNILIVAYNTRPGEKVSNLLPWEARYYSFDGEKFVFRDAAQCFESSRTEFEACAKKNIPSKTRPVTVESINPAWAIYTTPPELAKESGMVFRFQYLPGFIVTEGGYKTPGGGRFPDLSVRKSRGNTIDVIRLPGGMSTGPDITCETQADVADACVEIGGRVITTKSRDVEVLEAYEIVASTLKIEFLN